MCTHRSASQTTRSRRRFGIDTSRIVVTVRPPATEAHYHNPESDNLFIEFMNVARANGNVQVILLPRNKNPEHRLLTDWPQWFDDWFVIVPTVAVDGLISCGISDLVVSGGPTMNREAAALGLPVYSIFRDSDRFGIDRQLRHEGEIGLIEDVAEVKEKVSSSTAVTRKRAWGGTSCCAPALAAILNHIELDHGTRADEYRPKMICAEQAEMRDSDPLKLLLLVMQVPARIL